MEFHIANLRFSQLFEVMCHLFFREFEALHYQLLLTIGLEMSTL